MGPLAPWTSLVLFVIIFLLSSRFSYGKSWRSVWTRWCWREPAALGGRPRKVVSVRCGFFLLQQTLLPFFPGRTHMWGKHVHTQYRPVGLVLNGLLGLWLCSLLSAKNVYLSWKNMLFWTVWAFLYCMCLKQRQEQSSRNLKWNCPGSECKVLRFPLIEAFWDVSINI